MMFKTHIVAGFLVSMMILNYVRISKPFLFIGFVLIGSVLPDIDCPKSKTGRKFKFISKVIHFVFRHRGFMHTIYFPVIIYIGFSLLHIKTAGAGIALGYITHLICDSATREGLVLFYPISKRRLRGFIKTGGFAEYALFALLLFMALRISISHLDSLNL